ncbi:MAG: hypothetical protein WC346_09145 [Methanogenium sp.]|jgi:hypothetical protein
MEKRTQQKKKNWVKILLYLIPYLLFVSLGFILGMAYEQRLIYVSVGEALSYTNIQVNVNETKLIQEFNQTIFPQIKSMFNQTELNTKEAVSIPPNPKGIGYP